MTFSEGIRAPNNILCPRNVTLTSTSQIQEETNPDPPLKLCTSGDLLQVETRQKWFQDFEEA
jgi:hypothetical protein